ncbi:hypothetical protein D9M68_544770 [compost metagenome]
MFSGSAGVVVPPGCAKLRVTTGALVSVPALLNVSFVGVTPLLHTPPFSVVGAMALPSIV